MAEESVAYSCHGKELGSTDAWMDNRWIDQWIDRWIERSMGRWIDGWIWAHPLMGLHHGRRPDPAKRAQPEAKAWEEHLAAGAAGVEIEEETGRASPEP